VIALPAVIFRLQFDTNSADPEQDDDGPEADGNELRVRHTGSQKGLIKISPKDQLQNALSLALNMPFGNRGRDSPWGDKHGRT
jgi:hypothetical protein